MASLGLDPGKRGALSALHRSGALITWARTPLIGGEYDGRRMGRILKDVLAKCAEAGDPDLRAFVETPLVFNLQGPQAMAIGQGVGRWIQTLELLGIGWTFVHPQTWVRAYIPKPNRQKPPPGESKKDKDARLRKNRTENKAKLLAIAMQRWPVAVPWDRLNKEAQSGVADASLLADYGRLKG